MKSSGYFYYYLENPETKQATAELSDSTSRGQQPLGQGALSSFENNSSLNLPVEQLNATTNRGTDSLNFSKTIVILCVAEEKHGNFQDKGNV